MLRRLFESVLLIAILAALAQSANAEESVSIADFGEAGISDKLGVSVMNPIDPDQWINFKLEDQPDGRRVLNLEYDIDSNQPAEVEFWLRLEGADISRFDTLILKMRGDPEKGFTKNTVVQFTDLNGQKASYVLTGIESEWKEFRIPFKRFSRIRDWSRVKEFGIVFDAINTNPKKGVLYVSRVYVSTRIRSASK